MNTITKSIDGKPSKKVLLRLPPLLADAVDQAISELGQTRSSFIRESIGQRLHRYEKHEREIVLFLKQQTDEALGDR
jgi:metal-responsive CopG/Arc/MetJ family transcriptional regulator